MKLRDMSLAIVALSLAFLVGCSNLPSNRDIEKLESIQVMSEYLPDKDGIVLDGRLDTSSSNNMQFKVLVAGMNIYSINTAKVPVKVMSMGKKQEDNTWLVVLEVTVDGNKWICPTRVFYDNGGELHSRMVSQD